MSGAIEFDERLTLLVCCRMLTDAHRQFFSLVPSPSNQTVQLVVKLYWSTNGSNYDVQIEAPWSFHQGWLAVSLANEKKKKTPPLWSGWLRDSYGHRQRTTRSG